MKTRRLYTRGLEAQGPPQGATRFHGQKGKLNLTPWPKPEPVPVAREASEDPAPGGYESIRSPRPRAWKAPQDGVTRWQAPNPAQQAVLTPRHAALRAPTSVGGRTQLATPRMPAVLARVPSESQERQSRPDASRQGLRRPASGYSWGPGHNAQPHERLPGPPGCRRLSNWLRARPASSQSSLCGSCARQCAGSPPVSRRR